MTSCLYLIKNQFPLATSTEKKNENPLAKFMIGGGVSWTFELFLGHYLEVLKITKQTTNLSYRQITQNMTKQKGIIGVLDGYFPWGSLQCFIKGGALGFGHALGRTAVHGKVSDSTAEAIAGGIGGAFQGLIMSPILLLKTRVITDPQFRSTGGTWRTTIKATKLGFELVNREGLLVLMKGAGTFTAKRVADWTTRYYFAEKACEYVSGAEKRILTFKEKMFCSLVGGLLSATVTIPVDVLVATIQDASKAGKKVSIVSTISDNISNGGIKNLVSYSFRGYFARCLHVSLTTMLMKTATSAVYKKLNINETKE